MNSGFCLAIPNSSTADGLQAIQWTCTTNTDQQWPLR
ncbi:RICIN domain-containing protein [Streptomyces sp. NPDC059373]